MTNNEVFKKLLHLTGLNLNKELTQEIFRHGGVLDITSSKVRRFRSDANSKSFTPMSDEALSHFFSGLFAYRDEKALEGESIFNFTDSKKGNIMITLIGKNSNGDYAAIETTLINGKLNLDPSELAEKLISGHEEEFDLDDAVKIELCEGSSHMEVFVVGINEYDECFDAVKECVMDAGVYTDEVLFEELSEQEAADRESYIEYWDKHDS